ncbi:MAG: hypothetical protein C4289_08635, partial [Chloroflexota bacterium]
AVAELSRESAQFLASLGRTIRESINQALEGRANVLMVRVNDDTLRAIDELVQAGLFKTRSEAAAFLLHEGMKARRDILDSISETARRIEELRQQLRAIQQELGEENPEGAEANELRRQLDEADLPDEVRKEAERELSRMERLP